MNDSPAALPSIARLFVGLWPPDEVRHAVHAHAQRWVWPRAAAPVRHDKLHMTLHFLGQVQRGRIDELVQTLTVPFEAFELLLDHGELWSGGIAVLRATATPKPLQELHQRLQRALDRLGQPSARAHLKPHVTLARHAQGAVPPAQREDIRWPVNGFSLIESDQRPPGHYRILFTHP